MEWAFVADVFSKAANELSAALAKRKTNFRFTKMAITFLGANAERNKLESEATALFLEVFQAVYPDAPQDAESTWHCLFLEEDFLRMITNPGAIEILNPQVVVQHQTFLARTAELATKITSKAA